MKILVLSVLLVASISQAQVSTTTNRTRYGDTVFRNSNSIDYGEQNRQMQQAGAQTGATFYILTAPRISSIHQHHLVNSAVKAEAARYCTLPENSGSEWEMTDGYGKLRRGKCKGKIPASSQASNTEKAPPPSQASYPDIDSHQSIDVSAELLTDIDMAKLSDDDKVGIFANRFMHRHPEYIACPENAKFLIIYMQSHVKTDLPTGSDFEDAYQALKPTGILKLKR